MFERYTERARRVLFFARYEASQLGSVSIETEHLLLGLIREGKGLTSRIFARSHLSLEAIRKEVEGRTVFREKVSTSVEIPFSAETKRVLQFAAEEADQLSHNYIGTEHLLLGILREEQSVAATILMEKGMRLATVREDIVALLNEKTTMTRVKETPLLAEFSRDLSEAALKGSLDPLVGRETEIERVQQVLCRRTKNNAVLIGEPGVGKTAIVEGLAQKIAVGDVPHFLADKRILALDISLIVAGTKYRGQFEERLKAIMKELVENPNIIVFIDELHTLVGRGFGRGLARRGQHPQAGAVARRDPLHRRDDAGRVPQVHREGPVARAALPGRQGGSARARARRSRSCSASRSATRRSTTWTTRARRSRRRSTSRAATSPIASCPTRPSTCSTRPGRAPSCARRASARSSARSTATSASRWSRWRARSRRRTSSARSSSASRK